MPKGLQRSLSRGPKSSEAGRVKTKTIQLASAALTLDGATGVGFGSLVAGDFPEGNILFKGAVAYLSFSGSGSDAGLVDTWQGDYAVGTTPAGDATLSGADVDIIPSTAIAAATAEVSPSTRATNVTQAVFDNTDGSLEINVSLLVDDAHVSADGIPITVDGEIVIQYSVALDD